MNRVPGIRTIGVLLGVLIVSLWFAYETQAGPITFNTALPIAQGQWILRGQYLLIRANDDPTPLDRDLTVHAVPVVLANGVTARLAIFGIVPYVDKSLDVNTPAGRQTRRTSGVGDILCVGRYTVFTADRPGSTLRLAPFFGLKLPTGRHNETSSIGRLPQPLQPGSGSWDGLGGTTVTWQKLAWEFDADVGYRRNGEADRFRFGDEILADVSFQYRVWPRQIGSGVPGFLYAVFESNLSRQDRNEVAEIKDPDSGGTRWDIDSGLQYVTERYVFEAVVQVPVVERLHGNALETTYKVTIGFRWNFSLPFWVYPKQGVHEHVYKRAASSVFSQ